jgi:hypothetical protein
MTKYEEMAEAGRRVNDLFAEAMGSTALDMESIKLAMAHELFQNRKHHGLFVIMYDPEFNVVFKPVVIHGRPSMPTFFLPCV